MRKLRLLVVEDDPADQRLIADALAHADDNHYDFVTTGEEAGAYLHRAGAAAVDLVLLDLNLPGITGQEVLGEIRGSMALEELPVIIHSTSDHPRDVSECYRLGASGYIIKALELHKFRRNIGAIVRYWGVVERPVARWSARGPQLTAGQI